MSATQGYTPRIALVFDFDETLATDSMDALVQTWGLDRDAWEDEFADPLGDGWDEIIRRAQALIDCGNAKDEPLTRDTFERAAESIDLFDDVLTMPERLRKLCHEINDEIELHFIILSSGYIEAIEATGVSDVFDPIYAGAFHFDSEGRAIGLKRMISHPEKALYLEAIAKGVDTNGANTPTSADEPVHETEMWVPLDQMVYVGDGASDLQAFGFLNKAGGLPIAVRIGQDFDAETEQNADQHVENLAGPSYDDEAELFNSLANAVRSIAWRLVLRRDAAGE